tara:strand:- start:3453 stop:4064 length:612 start_codon:yes stop_codon:yes gene_type:complete
LSINAIHKGNPTYCLDCGVASKWCCCSQISSKKSKVKIVLLLHENEPSRPTSTSKIILKTLPNAENYIWKRNEPPSTLIEQINDKDTDAWLLFPADRPELKARQQAIKIDHKRNTLIIVPDGTWKEVRKIVRKSPWLADLPLLAFDPQTPSRYDLRRNPDLDHLCTAETVIELLELCEDKTPAENLTHAFDSFLTCYKASKRN